MNILSVSRGITLWMFVIFFSGIYFLFNFGSSDLKFYRFGPQDDLIILGIVVDTPLKYAILVLYAIINTFVRTLQHEVVSPWIINNIQDIERKQGADVKSIAYQVVSVNVIYQWVDWLLYMNMLLAQIDMVFVEIVCNLVASNVTTYLYMKYNVNNKKDLLLE